MVWEFQDLVQEPGTNLGKNSNLPRVVGIYLKFEKKFSPKLNSLVNMYFADQNEKDPNFGNDTKFHK